MDERLEIHLCNLHNEVFEAAESRINTECSLTIREGISSLLDLSWNSAMFPHYTWGYISLIICSCRGSRVPSLYVRVYRYRFSLFVDSARSLTIREGISSLKFHNLQSAKFPHYTWGYIEDVKNVLLIIVVPSLYVRVYRISFLQL